MPRTMSVAIFLDSNIFLYAVGSDHPFRQPCRDIVDRARTRSFEAIINTDVVQEVLHHLRRTNRLAAAIRVARDLLAAFPQLLATGHAELSRACDLIEQHPALRTRDALHAASMLHNRIDTIVTADRHFDGIQGIRRLDPATFAGTSPAL